MIPGSFTEDEQLAFLKEVAPYIDMVNVSVGMDCNHKANVHAGTTVFEKHKYNIEFAARLKRECDVLVCPVGAIMSPEEAEEVIAAGQADAVMMGRPLIADPYLPNKAMEDKSEDIVPCVRCLYCYHIATEHTNVQCTVNPRFIGSSECH